jgi:hypothetical protein
MNVETMQALRQRRRVQRSAWQPIRSPFALAVQSNSQTTVPRCAGSATHARITQMDAIAYQRDSSQPYDATA